MIEQLTNTFFTLATLVGVIGAALTVVLYARWEFMGAGTDDGQGNPLPPATAKRARARAHTAFLVMFLFFAGCAAAGHWLR